MRVFTFFLKTDTFKKKLELCQFFHKEYFYSFGSKISYICIVCVNVSTVQRQQITATLDESAPTCWNACTVSFSDIYTYWRAIYGRHIFF